MEKLIDFECYSVKKALKVLLKDKSTKKNIIWATDPPDYDTSDYICAGRDSTKNQQGVRRTTGTYQKKGGSVYTSMGM